MPYLGVSASHILTPRVLEVAAGLVVLACAATSARTLSVALSRWRENRRFGEPGPLLFAWMQLRTETLLFAAQLIALGMTLYRLYHPDVYSSIGRASIAVLVAVVLATNRRDFHKL